MRLLVTAGNTFAMIDRVRGITNVFSGRTGASIAAHAHALGHTVTLLTSRPETAPASPVGLEVFNTFESLASRLEYHVRTGQFDAVIHTAAVSDFLTAGIYTATPAFDPSRLSWPSSPQMHDRAAGKVKSDTDELWLRLVRAPKLIDLIRPAWGFRGVLVKFKLEVAVSEDELRNIAEQSRRQSAADILVANTLEGAAEWALITTDTGIERIKRADLPRLLVERIEGLHQP